MNAATLAKTDTEDGSESTKHRDAANRPVSTFKVKGSGVEVALWRNGDNYSASFSNSYKDGDTYKPTTNYSMLDIITLQGLLAMAAAKGIELQQVNRGRSAA
jgi:hypothetical protein